MSKRRPYKEPMPTNWWLKNTFYTKYMLREGTSVFVAIYSLVLLAGLGALAHGPESWQLWLNGLTSPLSLAFHLVAFIAAMYHAITWFDVAPKTMHLQVGTKKVEDKLITQVHWVGFVIATIVVFALVLWL